MVAEPENPVEVIGVRFKPAGKVYYFSPGEIKAEKYSYVIVETARGTEFGEVALANKIVDASQIVPPLRNVLRIATEADIARNAENKEKEKEAFRVCVEKIAEHGLDMKLVDVEYTFDRNKLLFYFTSEGRVDFRELVKNLASIFRTRIELRQIGIRDEAKLMGGLGVCGRSLCCSSFLSDFVQVSIKMAKEQNLSLNSSKISGVCGRLMCCLRYESETYEAELRRSPALDALVRTPDGTGVVTEVNPLAGTVRVRFPENTPPPKLFSRDDVKVIGRAGKGGRPDELLEGEET
ncbi:MAG: stage 0 sporulation family protein [Clostridia bacterium]|nr:stage 0 sporulation family protein [Clostridia bacterium]